jgi:hypothetical protein
MLDPACPLEYPACSCKQQFFHHQLSTISSHHHSTIMKPCDDSTQMMAPGRGAALKGDDDDGHNPYLRQKFNPPAWRVVPPNQPTYEVLQLCQQCTHQTQQPAINQSMPVCYTSASTTAARGKRKAAELQTAHPSKSASSGSAAVRPAEAAISSDLRHSMHYPPTNNSCQLHCHADTRGASVTRG